MAEANQIRATLPRWRCAAKIALCVLVACGDGSSRTEVCAESPPCPAGQTCPPRSDRCEPATARTITAVAMAEGAPLQLQAFRSDGAACPGAVCSDLPAGASLTFRAPEVPGFRFKAWKGSSSACVGPAPDLVLSNVQADVLCIAEYAARVRVTVVDPHGDGYVTVSASASSAHCTGSSCEVDLGSEVILTATDRPASRFRRFSGAGCETDASPLVIPAAPRDLICRAEYTTRYTVLANVANGPPDAVRATSSSRTARCEGPRCMVDAMAEVDLTASHVPGLRFAGWSGGGPCTGVEATLHLAGIAADYTCTAHYTARRTVAAESRGPEPAPLITAETSEASGRCAGSRCEVDVGGSVTLVAPTVPGYRLDHWSGAACEGQTSSAVHLRDVQENLSCTAHYVRGVSVNGALINADGEVVASSGTPFATCARGACSIDVGGNVTLTAPAIADRRFVGWEGDPACTSEQPSISLRDVMSSITCRARYVDHFTVRGLVSMGDRTVRAQSNSPNARCTANACSVDSGGTVSLTVSSYSSTGGSDAFRGWMGGGPCTGTDELLELTNVRSSFSCTAVIVRRFRVAGWPDPQTSGGSVTATSTAPFAECADSECEVDPGQDVVLTAVPRAGARFIEWSNCGKSTAASIVVTATEPYASCTAIFR